ncbi:MAG: endonuclease III [Clostridiales bacterium]|nr:endonuclease III [Clostridiales bacterium]
MAAEGKRAKKRRAAEIVSRLEEVYPGAQCSLDYKKDYELLFSVRLAAQCTDARVNLITPALFRDYPTLEAFAQADLEALEQAVRPCGFYHVKARDIQQTARLLLERHGGRVPDSMEALLALPGVGRKTANLMMGDLFGAPAIVTDTHCIRISNRLGLVGSKVPEKVELQLIPLIAPEKQNDFCHRLVLFGRDTCSARKPRCAGCPLDGLCPRAGL